MTRLREVADRAGVSPATVSRVVNDPSKVNERTRARVESAIRELGYRPSRVARRLRVEGGCSSLVGLVIPDIQNPFFADLARGVEDAAQRHGYAVFLGNSDDDPEKERRYLEVMRSESVDGVILPPSSDSDEAAREVIRAGIPFVCVDRRLGKAKVDTVVVDNVAGAYDAVEHLVQMGHRRIGFLVGKLDLSTSRERLEGYRRALADHGLEHDPTLVLPGDSRQTTGRERTAELLARPDPPSALLVGNSLMTLGALEAINAAGVRVPEDLAIVGYDDMPWAMAVSPPLTVVRQPGYELGRQAMELLLQRIREPARSTVVVTLQSELVVRRSSRPKVDGRVA